MTGTSPWVSLILPLTGIEVVMNRTQSGRDNELVLLENLTLDSIFAILQSANESKSRPTLIRSILSNLTSLTGCELISLDLGYFNDAERCRAGLDRAGNFSFQNIVDNENSLPDEDITGEKIGPPRLIPKGIWPSQPCLWKRGEVEPNSVPFADQWSNWISGHPHLNNMKAVLVQPFSCSQEANGLIALAFSRLDHATQDAQTRVAQQARFIGLTINNWQNMTALQERVKELSCLYGLAQLLDPPDKALKEVLQGVVELLPPAWLHARDASARIEYAGNEYFSSGYRAGGQTQSAILKVAGKNPGIVEVSYVEEKPDLDEGPFLNEERALLDNVARQIGQRIERDLYETEKKQIMDKLRRADRLAMMGQLAATVAHEINEPLTSILGYAQLAAKSPELPPQISGDIAKVVSISLHLREVVKKTLLFSRRMPPKTNKVELNGAIRETMELFAWRCQREGIELELNLAEEELIIIADPGQIRQIITNLTVNAIQAMNNGGTLHLKTFCGTGEAVFCLEDTGSGIPGEILDKIFIPFFSTKEAGSGTGLGLSVVHDIVAEMGGRINVHSEAGSGTIFEVRLPYFCQKSLDKAEVDEK